MLSSSRIIKSTIVGGSEIISLPVIPVIPVISAIPKNIEPEIPVNENTDNASDIISETNLIIEKMLDDAKIKSEEILKNAEAESEKLKKVSKDAGYQEGYKKGYKDGYDFGIKEANSEGLNIRKAADDYRSSCEKSVKQYLNEKEEEIIHLAVAIAKQIVNTELTINPEAIFKIAEKVVSKAVDRKQIVLKVNPKDFPIIKNKKDDLSIYVENSNNIFLIADSAIKQGSIKAETPSGFIDADIDVQIDAVLKGLLGE